MQVNIHLKVPTVSVCARHLEVVKLSSKDAFLAVYDDVQAYLLELMEKQYAVDKHRKNYLKVLMDVACTGGKYNRGITVVEVAKAMTAGSETQPQAVYDACICGWVIEFLQAHFLVEDDIMDSSVTRRGAPCWYRHPGVTTQCAINDGLIVLAWCTQLLSYFLSHHPMLSTILLQFHKVDMQTTIGQLYDVSSMFDSAKLDPHKAQPTTTDYAEFTLHHYKRIVKWKTAFYTYHLPLIFGLSVCNKLSSVDQQVVEDCACLMGEYFQIQDDFLDCFGDPAIIGKVGTDIEDVKCSWLAVTFLANASEKDIETFKANYGQHDAAKVEKIKELYREAKLSECFGKYEGEVATKMKEYLSLLKKTNEGFAAAVELLWNRTFKRTK